MLKGSEGLASHMHNMAHKLTHIHNTCDYVLKTLPYNGKNGKTQKINFRFQPNELYYMKEQPFASKKSWIMIR